MVPVALVLTPMPNISNNFSKVLTWSIGNCKFVSKPLRSNTATCSCFLFALPIASLKDNSSQTASPAYSINLSDTIIVLRYETFFFIFVTLKLEGWTSNPGILMDFPGILISTWSSLALSPAAAGVAERRFKRSFAICKTVSCFLKSSLSFVNTFNFDSRSKIIFNFSSVNSFCVSNFVRMSPTRLRTSSSSSTCFAFTPTKFLSQSSLSFACNTRTSARIFSQCRLFSTISFSLALTSASSSDCLASNRRRQSATSSSRARISPAFFFPQRISASLWSSLDLIKFFFICFSSAWNLLRSLLAIFNFTTFCSVSEMASSFCLCKSCISRFNASKKPNESVGRLISLIGGSRVSGTKPGSFCSLFGVVVGICVVALSFIFPVVPTPRKPPLIFTTVLVTTRRSNVTAADWRNCKSKSGLSWNSFSWESLNDFKIEAAFFFPAVFSFTELLTPYVVVHVKKDEIIPAASPGIANTLWLINIRTNNRINKIVEFTTIIKRRNRDKPNFDNRESTTSWFLSIFSTTPAPLFCTDIAFSIAFSHLANALLVTVSCNASSISFAFNLLGLLFAVTKLLTEKWPLRISTSIGSRTKPCLAIILVTLDRRNLGRNSRLRRFPRFSTTFRFSLYRSRISLYAFWNVASRTSVRAFAFIFRSNRSVSTIFVVGLSVCFDFTSCILS